MIPGPGDYYIATCVGLVVVGAVLALSGNTVIGLCMMFGPLAAVFTLLYITFGVSPWVPK